MASALHLKQLEALETRMKMLEESFSEFEQRETNDMHNFVIKVMQLLEEQRVEIVRLCEEIKSEREDRRNRRRKALEQFKSE